jgi:hypothetical protein
MIIWGGYNNGAQSTGGRYNPISDTWAPMSFDLHEPSSRYCHTAEWTGTEMIVWGGGFDGLNGVNTGGAYCATCANPSLWYLDADLDGFGLPGSGVLSCSPLQGRTLNSTDCNDGNAGIHPGAAEQCGIVDRNCDGVLETTVPPEIMYQPVQKIGGVPRYSWLAPPNVTRFDHYRGIYSGAIGTDPFFEFCLGNDTTQTFWDDPNPPEAGTFWWFLVSAVNSCGRGTLGFRTNHGTPTTERISLVCP